MDQFGQNGLFMDFSDQSIDMFAMAPSSEQATSKGAQIPMANADQHSSQDNKGNLDTIYVLLKLIVEYQVKMGQQLTDLQQKVEQKIDQQSQKLEQKIDQQSQKLEQKIDQQNQKLEHKIHQQSERFEKQETCLLERSQMIIERVNECAGMLEMNSLGRLRYTDSEYSNDHDSLNGPSYTDSEFGQGSESSFPELDYP
ncbi:hypothetical protein AUP68_06419 [Ilyonectria robusta]